MMVCWQISTMAVQWQYNGGNGSTMAVQWQYNGGHGSVMAVQLKIVFASYWHCIGTILALYSHRNGTPGS